MADDDAPAGAPPGAVTLRRATAHVAAGSAAVLCALLPWAPGRAFMLESDELRARQERPAQALPVRAPYDKTLDFLLGRGARGYRLAGIRAGRAAVPRLALAALPRDFASLRDVSQRKTLFLQSVLPLVLLVNEEIRALRAELARAVTEAAGADGASPQRRAFLAAVAARYGVDDGAWTALLRRVDTVPVSLALAQAVQESGWGRSRFARGGNALFGQRTWRDDVPGLVPAERADGAEHRVRSFPDLLSAVRTYMHNLNTHPAYAEFRRDRALARARGVAPDASRLALRLTRYAEHGDGYVEALRGILRANRLRDFDAARLADPAWTKLADIARDRRLGP